MSEIQRNSLFSKINVVSDTHIVNIYHILSIFYLAFMLAKMERCRKNEAPVANKQRTNLPRRFTKSWIIGAETKTMLCEAI